MATSLVGSARTSRVQAASARLSSPQRAAVSASGWSAVGSREEPRQRAIEGGARRRAVPVAPLSFAKVDRKSDLGGEPASQISEPRRSRPRRGRADRGVARGGRRARHRAGRAPRPSASPPARRRDRRAPRGSGPADPIRPGRAPRPSPRRAPPAYRAPAPPPARRSQAARRLSVAPRGISRNSAVRVSAACAASEASRSARRRRAARRTSESFASRPWGGIRCSRIAAASPGRPACASASASCSAASSLFGREARELAAEPDDPLWIGAGPVAGPRRREPRKEGAPAPLR